MSSTLEYTAGLILLAAGVALLAWVVVPTIRTLRNLLRENQERVARARETDTIQRIDFLLENEDWKSGAWDEAATLIRDSFVYDRPNGADDLRRTREYNENLLARLVEVGDRYGVHLLNLGEVERLFVERNEIYAAALRSENVVRLSLAGSLDRKSLGPKLNSAEIERQQQDLNEQLARSKQQIELALAKLYSSLTAPSAESVTYH